MAIEETSTSLFSTLTSFFLPTYVAPGPRQNTDNPLTLRAYAEAPAEEEQEVPADEIVEEEPAEEADEDDDEDEDEEDPEDVSRAPTGGRRHFGHQSESGHFGTFVSE